VTYPPHNNTAAHAKGTTQLRVSLLAVWLTKFGEAHKQDPKLMALYGLIAPALAACMESCGAADHQRKQQSAAVCKRAKLELKWVERVRIDELGPTPETPDAWAAWWIALDAIAADGRATWDQGRNYCWTRLCDGVEALAMELLGRARNPARAEVAGARMYERAMEASLWVDHSIG
jgi:hypothetical protein